MLHRADPIKQKRNQAEARRIARAAYLRAAIAPASRPANLVHRVLPWAICMCAAVSIANPCRLQPTGISRKDGKRLGVLGGSPRTCRVTEA
jgi:hypothetical protein